MTEDAKPTETCDCHSVAPAKHTHGQEQPYYTHHLDFVDGAIAGAIGVSNASGKTMFSRVTSAAVGMSFALVGLIGAHFLMEALLPKRHKERE